MMRLPSARGLLAALAIVVAAGFARSQPGPVLLQSLDVMVLNSDTVAVATVKSFTLAPDCRTIVDATFTVDAQIKGNVPAVPTLPVRQAFYTFEQWVEGKARVLLLGTGGDYRIVSLTGPESTVLQRDFTPLRSADAVIRAAKRIAASSLGAQRVETVSLAVPHDKWKYLSRLGSGVYIDVPVDKQLETWAVETLRQGDKNRRGEAATILSRFKSDRNIELLKGLLNDPYSSNYDRPQERMGHGHKIYAVRQTAYNTLTAWGVQVAKPVIEETYEDPDAVFYAFLEGSSDISDRIKNLTRFKNLTDLYLSRTATTDSDLEVIARLPGIKKLELRQTGITDAGMDAISRMSNLRELDLTSTAVTARGLEKAASLHSLERLAVGNTQIGDEAISVIAKMTSLRSLVIGNTRITPAGIRGLMPLKNLMEIKLPRASWQMTEDWFVALAEAGLLHACDGAYGLGDRRVANDREVVSLLCYSQPITDQAFKAFATMHNLHRLDLSNSKITDGSMKTVAGFPRLAQLILNDTAITDVGLRTLSALPKLDSLGLYHANVTDAGLQCLAGKKLKWLGLGGTKITDAGIASLAQMTSLNSLLLSGTAVTEGSMRSIAKLPHLGFLMLDHTAVTDAGLMELVAAKDLRRIGLWESPNVTTEALSKFRHLRPEIAVDR